MTCETTPLYTLENLPALECGEVAVIAQKVEQAAATKEQWMPGRILMLDVASGSFKDWDGTVKDQQLTVLRACVNFDGVTATQQAAMIATGSIFDTALDFAGKAGDLTLEQKATLQLWGLTVIPSRNLDTLSSEY